MIYIHIPFCKSFCTYCDFYSEICSQKVQKLFVDELCKEIGERRAEIESTLGLNTLYIGGGTPSVLEPELADGFVEKLGESSAGRIYTYCASCTGRFKRCGLSSVEHVLPLIMDTGERPDTAKSYVNRVLTRFR